jgi:hypothetical protein
MRRTTAPRIFVRQGAVSPLPHACAASTRAGLRLPGVHAVLNEDLLTAAPQSVASRRRKRRGRGTSREAFANRSGSGSRTEPVYQEAVLAVAASDEMTADAIRRIHDQWEPPFTSMLQSSTGWSNARTRERPLRRRTETCKWTAEDWGRVEPAGPLRRRPTPGSTAR